MFTANYAQVRNQKQQCSSYNYQKLEYNSIKNIFRISWKQKYLTNSLSRSVEIIRVIFKVSGRYFFIKIFSVNMNRSYLTVCAHYGSCSNEQILISNLNSNLLSHCIFSSFFCVWNISTLNFDILLTFKN